MKKNLLLLFIAVMLGSCGVTTNYLGKSYTPTSKVDLFFVWNDVPYKYEVMGYLDATMNGLSTIEQAQKKIESKAREKGADAVVFEGVETSIVNPTTTTTVDTNKNADGGKTKTITSTQSANGVSTLKATLIKYK